MIAPYPSYGLALEDEAWRRKMIASVLRIRNDSGRQQGE
jgi:hypothetical protein